MKLGVFVLGMHRSGTSAATRLVNLLGMATCIDEDLSPTKADNPRGHWESESLTRFNDRILAALGCDWSCPVALEPGWEADPALEELRAEAVELFPRLFPSDHWVWKDPRNCLTFPFWARCLDVRPVAVVVHRNPLEIAASLGARDDFGAMFSLALWERYLRLCLGAISGLPALLTDYADLLSDPLGWCRRFREFANGAGAVTAALRDEDALEFVDGGLRHTRFSAEDVLTGDTVSEPQRRLYLAVEATLGAHERFRLPGLPAETSSTEALLEERRRAYALECTYLELEDHVRNLGERFLVLTDYARELRERDHSEFVPPGHFYSAIPAFDELAARSAEIFERDPLHVQGVDLRLEDQLTLLDELALLADDVPFGDEPTDGLRYHYRNGVFEQSDGLFLHLMLRRFRPARVIEVGSGFSSACTLDTVERFLGPTACTFIDPYPDALDSVLRPEDHDRVDVIAQPVQAVLSSVFEQLASGDLLFIDSTHVSKAGSDVNHLVFDVVPALRPGVLVHFHDVFPGFEYPVEWHQQRRVWSESYLLRAFLQFNDAFEIVLWPRLLSVARPDELERFPKALENLGGSIYVRRTG